MWLFFLEPVILKWQLNYLQNYFLMPVCQIFREKNFIILYSSLTLSSPNWRYWCLPFFGNIIYLCHLIGTSISALDSYSLLERPKYLKCVKFAYQKRNAAFNKSSIARSEQWHGRTFDLLTQHSQLVMVGDWILYGRQWVKVQSTDRQGPFVTLSAHSGDFL